MPLLEPEKAKGLAHSLREKILLIGEGKVGKTSCWLSIAWWAFQSGDTRQFYVMDTDQAVLDVMNEPRYEGMLAEDGGNVHLFQVYDWREYEEAGLKIRPQVNAGDFIVFDFITHAWAAAQNGFLMDATKKTREQSLYESGVEGNVGWDMYRTDFNWQAINAAYFGWLKPLLLGTQAHIFMVSEQDEIQQGASLKDQKEHLAQYGKYKFVGQKKLPYQCRSYLRIQRLARGRVLYTLGDRARKVYEGDDCGDFFKTYLGDAGWKVEDGG